MGVILSLPQEPVLVDAGHEATCEVRLRNDGAVVDQFLLDVLGDAAEWAELKPAKVNVFPGESETVQLVLKPPRSHKVAAGETTFAVRAVSHEDPEGSAIEEGIADVGSFTESNLDLIPHTGHGRRTVRYKLAVDNLGNAPLLLDLFATDEDAQLKYRFRSTAVTVERGMTLFVPLKVRPKKMLLHGRRKSYTFECLGVDPAEQETKTNGALSQVALVSPAALKLMALATVGVLALVALWFTVLKPSVQTTATQAAASQNAQAAGAIVQAQQAAQAANQGAQTAQKQAQSQASTAQQQAKTAQTAQAQAQTAKQQAQAAQAGTAPGGAAAGGAAGAGSSSTSAASGSSNLLALPALANGSGTVQAADFRLQSNASPTANGSFSTTASTIPAKTTTYISDIFLENPNGDSGVLELRRGTAVLLQVSLDSFRNLDYHFVQPIQFAPADQVVLAVNCVKPGSVISASGTTPQSTCTPAAYFSTRNVVTP